MNFTEWMGYLAKLVEDDSRVAHEEAFARPVGFAHFRRFPHSLHTLISSSAPSDSASLTHRASVGPLLLSRVPILVDPAHPATSIATTLDGHPLQNGGEPQRAPSRCKTGCRAGYHALPPMFSFKSWPAALVSFYSFLLTRLPYSDRLAGSPYAFASDRIRHYHVCSLSLVLVSSALA